MEQGGRRVHSAFLNVPYDRPYEPLYLAFIAGLCGFGLTPRATVEIPGGERRLDRILSLIRGCEQSFHDLSRVQADPGHPRTPRFNMPFELGLTVACAKLQRSRPHVWFVFEAVRHRLNKSLSDLSGTDPHIHQNRPRVLLRELANALVRARHQPSVEELEQVYADLRGTVPALRRRLRAQSLFEARPFRDLVVLASRMARRRVASLRR
jgi:hypothetical protein